MTDGEDWIVILLVEKTSKISREFSHDFHDNSPAKTLRLPSSKGGHDLYERVYLDDEARVVYYN